MAITLAQVESALSQALTLVNEFAPLASLGGPAAGAIGAAVGAIAGAAEKVVTQVEGDATIIASGNTANITALQQQLQQQNAALAEQIATS